MKSVDIRHRPSSNGEAERAAKIFKESMKTVKKEPGTLVEKLAHFLLGYQTTPHCNRLYTCRNLDGKKDTDLDLLHPNLAATISGKEDGLIILLQESGDLVMVKDHRSQQQLRVKGIVQDRLGTITYRVMVVLSLILRNLLEKAKHVNF